MEKEIETNRRGIERRGEGQGERGGFSEGSLRPPGNGAPPGNSEQHTLEAAVT